MTEEETKEICDALEPWVRAARVMDVISVKPHDDDGVRRYLPGVWPTAKNLRDLRKMFEKLGGVLG
jgi:hypothetical protein